MRRDQFVERIAQELEAAGLNGLAPSVVVAMPIDVPEGHPVALGIEQAFEITFTDGSRWAFTAQLLGRVLVDGGVVLDVWPVGPMRRID